MILEDIMKQKLYLCTFVSKDKDPGSFFYDHKVWMKFVFWENVLNKIEIDFLADTCLNFGKATYNI